MNKLESRATISISLTIAAIIVVGGLIYFLQLKDTNTTAPLVQPPPPIPPPSLSTGILSKPTNYAFRAPLWWNVVRAGDDNLLTFFGPDATENGGLGGVQVQAFKGSLDDYFDSLRINVGSGNFYDKRFEGVDGNSAIRYRYNDVINGEAVATKKGGYIYSIYINSRKNVDLVLFDELLNSFQFTKNSQQAGDLEAQCRAYETESECENITNLDCSYNVCTSEEMCGRWTPMQKTVTCPTLPASSREECENKENRICVFVSCPSASEGKMPQEWCGKEFWGDGWYSIGKLPNPDESLVVWKRYRNETIGFEFLYHEYLTLENPSVQLDPQALSLDQGIDVINQAYLRVFPMGDKLKEYYEKGYWVWQLDPIGEGYSSLEEEVFYSKQRETIYKNFFERIEEFSDGTDCSNADPVSPFLGPVAMSIGNFCRVLVSSDGTRIATTFWTGQGHLQFGGFFVANGYLFTASIGFTDDIGYVNTHEQAEMFMKGIMDGKIARATEKIENMKHILKSVVILK